MRNAGRSDEEVAAMNNTAVRYMNNIRNSGGRVATRVRNLIDRDREIRMGGRWGFIGEDTVREAQAMNDRRYSQSTYMGLRAAQGGGR